MTCYPLRSPSPPRETSCYPVRPPRGHDLKQAVAKLMRVHPTCVHVFRNGEGEITTSSYCDRFDERSLKALERFTGCRVTLREIWSGKDKYYFVEWYRT